LIGVLPTRNRLENILYERNKEKSLMSDDREIIQTIRTQTLNLIQQITAQPKPSYELDGQKVTWTEYLARLVDVVNWCDQRLAADTPCEIRSLGLT